MMAAKVTTKGSVSVEDIKSFTPEDVESFGRVTVAKKLDNGIQLKVTAGSEALATTSLSGCSVSVVRPRVVNITCSLDSKTTKLVYTNAGTIGGKPVSAKLTWNQKGNKLTGESTIDLGDDVSLTGWYDFRARALVGSAFLEYKGVTFEPEYDFSSGEPSAEISVERTVRGVPVTCGYEIFSRSVVLGLNLSPATVELSAVATRGTAVGISLTASKTFEF